MVPWINSVRFTSMTPLRLRGWVHRARGDFNFIYTTNNGAISTRLFKVNGVSQKNVIFYIKAFVKGIFMAVNV